MVDEDGYCTECDSDDCLHAQLFNALAEVAYWKRKATERPVESRRSMDNVEVWPCSDAFKSDAKAGS